MRNEKKKCIIFGASEGGRKAFNTLVRNYDVIGFSDNSEQKWDTEFCGRKVLKPLDLAEYQDCEIIIASVYYAAIHIQLREMGMKHISVYYRLGNPMDKKEERYKLYKLSDGRLFEKCVSDEKLWKKISEDFSLNYTGNGYSRNTDIKCTGRKNVLFCAYIFPPLGGSGVQRSLKFVKYLRKFGYEPTVLTVGMSDKRIMADDTLLNEIPDDIKIIRVDCNDYLPEALSDDKQKEIFNLYGGVVQSGAWMEEYLRRIEKHNVKIFPDNRIIWVNECLRNIESLIDLKKVDIVFTTGNPFSTYLLGYYIKQKYNVKWVQDYRDPWATNEYYIKNYYKDWKRTIDLQQILEKCLTCNADAIVTVGKHFMKEYVSEYGISAEKIYAITNGYDEEDFQGIENRGRSKKFTLCYNGTLYLERNPAKLLTIINELIDEKKIDIDAIQWIFNGDIEKRWKQAIEQTDRYGIVKYNGYLSHSESIQSAINSDMLVLFGTSVGYTGKVFEYIRMKRPILSMSPATGVLDELLEDTKTGKNFVYDDREKIKEYLLKFYRQWTKGEEIFSVDDNTIQKFSREYGTQLLARIFDTVLEEKLS